MYRLLRTCWGALFGALLCISTQVHAQQDGGLSNVGVVQSLILTVAPEALYTQSDFGKRIAREIEAESLEIAADNRRIEAELTAEERELTELRDSLDPAEFRSRAEAFDEKVQRLRREQDEKARAVGTRNEEARRALLTAAQPILLQLMIESGAVAVLDRRVVLLSVDSVDITEQAILRVNDEFGDGEAILPLRP
ncbi:OmpH family outer membrane protein [Marivita sp. XM-24bin2]|jgi:Skp family chaperone for outer membrane proteins|uniref:OmpH family outer membrane protein n=1 Tax=unclassified Marivita TaxID=2632480 RepID=UPI000D79043A|nr:OmpH family outer membrane protein [Marivita sp. XM-24bin2]MCR9109279.1 OmpH family outer membrane protein [Paracoccaceae bacterium]PWL34465.1 MAG: outer membrane chaperone Skp [Marivita sp. XM-24bin2]